MKTLRSFVSGKWHTATSGFANLADPCSEEIIARASSEGVDFGAALEFARREGGAALAGMTIAERGAMLAEMAKVLFEHRQELIDLSLENTGTTRKDAKFDIDGATFTLSHYAEVGKKIGSRRFFTEGDGVQLGRTSRFWGQHLLLPLNGVAVHINAFNFPVWGFGEKAACALLAGVPVITKPATSSAMVAERAVEIIIESGVVPVGVFSMICGSTGDLLDRLGPQDVMAFTGSASTALKLRGKPNLLSNSTRVNIEADSLNAAILGPGVDRGGETWGAFLRDVSREISQKSGQKCTAVRRILVPRDDIDDVQEALLERLGEVVVGDPRDASVTMGPLATAGQLDDAVAGVRKLREDAEIVAGTGERVDGVGATPGRGFYFAPTLLRVTGDKPTPAVHAHEVFAPVSTLIPYDGSAGEAAEAVHRGGGSLVTSLYTDEMDFLTEYVSRGGTSSGRLYVGSEKVAGQLPGSGVAMPHVLHGGPGRAGGGSELGGARGLELYLQRVAVTGDRSMIEKLTEA